MKALDRLTIGRLAKASAVGIETVRYYQRRVLLSVPRASGAVRYYPVDLVRRIGFIKKAQTLGFSLKEVATLLDLADGRNRRAVQSVTAAMQLANGRNLTRQVFFFIKPERS